MNKTTGRLKEYTPLKYNDKTNKYIISWGLTEIGDKYYQWNYQIIDKKPSLKEIKNIINANINKIVKNAIENKFKWGGMDISLSVEKQIDYKLLFDTTILLEGKNLPETVKFKIKDQNIYYTFETIDDMKDFIIALNNHIRSCVQQGNDMKDSINLDDYIL